jgi:hypothetical protein
MDLHEQSESGSGHRLPAEAAAFAAIIGVEATVTLMLEVGGTRMFIPKRPTAQSPLSAVIGLEAAARLGDAMGGERPYVPICRSFVARYLRARGATLATLARRRQCAALRTARGGP